MPFCASPILTPEGTSASGPAAAPPPSPPRAGGQRGEAAPTRGPEADRHRQQPAEPVSPAGPSAEPGGAPFSVLTLPAAEERRAGQGRAGGTAATPPGVPAPPASQRRTEPPLPAPQRGGAAPPPAQRPRREGGGCSVPAPGSVGRPFPGAGFGRRALPPPSRLQPAGCPAGRRREGLTGWGPSGTLRSASAKKREPLLSPSLVGSWVPREVRRGNTERWWLQEAVVIKGVEWSSEGENRWQRWDRECGLWDGVRNGPVGILQRAALSELGFKLKSEPDTRGEVEVILENSPNSWEVKGETREHQECWGRGGGEEYTSEMGHL